MGITFPKVYAPLLLQFKPMSERRKEDDYDTLLVYLPGFEDIEVTTEDLNIVRVRGERWTNDGNISQVNEDYRVPENCEMRGIHSRLDGGILTITMPRKIVNTPIMPDKPDKQAVLKPQINLLEDTTLPPQHINVPKKDKHNVVEKPNVVEKTWLDAGEGVHALLEGMNKNSKDGMGQKNDGFRGDKTEGNKKGVARRGMMNQDRKLLVNVGVGVLVIVALGVHLFYTIGLIGKGK